MDQGAPAWSTGPVHTSRRTAAEARTIFLNMGKILGEGSGDQSVGAAGATFDLGHGAESFGLDGAATGEAVAERASFEAVE